MEEKIKRLSVIIILTALVCPLVLYWFPIFKEKPLQGSFALHNDVRFNIENWYDETFQTGKEKFLNQEFGLRKTLLRINNQLYYSLFDIAKANQVVVGKEGYLYEENYIKDYYGINYIGDQKINEVTRRLSSIDSVFKTLNKTLLVVFAPGKASFYPEYIPSHYTKQGDKSNYRAFRSAIEKSSIKFIDFNQHFQYLKSRSKRVLYPKTGIHWSDYGAALAADSISKFLGKVRNYNPVELYWEEYSQKHDSVSEIDGDIEYGMNLFFDIDKPRLSYPVIKFESANRHKPKVLTVGDSFYMNLFKSNIDQNIFDNPSFGFYFKQLHTHSGVSNIDQANVKSLIDSHDVVILMATESTMFNFPFEFDKIVHKIYCTDLSNPEVVKARIEEIKNTIRNTPDWMKIIEEKAKAQNIPLEEALDIDAKYVLFNQ